MKASSYFTCKGVSELLRVLILAGGPFSVETRRNGSKPIKIARLAVLCITPSRIPFRVDNGTALPLDAAERPARGCLEVQ